MNIHTVHTNAIIGGEHFPHARAWAADWHAWKIAEATIDDPEWNPDPCWGPPGWAFAETGEVTVWVETQKVTVP